MRLVIAIVASVFGATAIAGLTTSTARTAGLVLVLAVVSLPL
ncbi:DUF1328 domain-containing protein [Natronococcus pandeyae]|uniref:DUF1328 domain-containing protein n=1 Tax=Natronococcus pandeyae TaxID=2055836 RepID=A0A8J8Q842_9EURY|nr:DUF1328 domain-containing protein [Natronococcus pandeyae]